MNSVVLCSGPENGMDCFAQRTGPCVASYERMDKTGAWHPVCYECVKTSRRLGWRTRKLHTQNSAFAESRCPRTEENTK